MNEFSNPPINFKPHEAPETPYQRASDEWDRRMGSVVVQAKNWRICALSLCGITAVLLIGLIFQSAKSTVTPYVVEVTKEGLVQAVGPAAQNKFKPGEPVIKYFLAQWVEQVRSLPLDPVVAKDHWLKAYSYLRQSAANTLNEIAQKENPLAKLGKETTSVNVGNVVALSMDTYQVRWEEKRYSKEGATIESKIMTGAFTVEIDPPTDQAQLLKNPLGLYITRFSWSQDVK
ncbi:MAG: conjugal transfer protein TrbF [Desulfuromonadales bacterium]|nr:conjugal transfer protein TrbF [Desulfuromonadales bacterium]